MTSTPTPDLMMERYAEVSRIFWLVYESMYVDDIFFGRSSNIDCEKIDKLADLFMQWGSYDERLFRDIRFRRRLSKKQDATLDDTVSTLRQLKPLLAKRAESSEAIMVELAYIQAEDPFAFTSLPIIVELAYIQAEVALALLLRITNGYSDEVRDAFQRAYQATYLFFRAHGYSWDPQLRPSTEIRLWVLEDVLYTGVVANITLTTVITAHEMFQLRAFDGQYAEALHMLQWTLFGIDYAKSHHWKFAHEYEVNNQMGEIRSDFYDFFPKLSAHDRLGDCVRRLPALPPLAQQGAEVFEKLRVSAENVNWRQVAVDCNLIREHWASLEEGEAVVIRDPDGNCWNSTSYWLRATGYAQAKLKRDELADYLEADNRRREEEKAKEDLLTYFLEPSQYEVLPTAVKRSLVEAVKAWLSTKDGRLDRFLNEVRLAVEGILYSAVWSQFRQIAMKNPEPRLGKIRELQASLDANKHQPSLAHYISLLRDRQIQGFVRNHGLYRKHELLLVKLPDELKPLSEARKKSEHPEHPSMIELTQDDPGASSKRDELGLIFNRIFGINCAGLLADLVSLYVDVKRSVADRPHAKPVERTSRTPS